MSNPYNTDGLLTFPTTGWPITQNALESIECTIALDVRDWGQDRRSAWIYAIVFWDPDDDDEWESVSKRFGWDDDDKDRARRMHEQWVKAKAWLDEVDK